jgi:uncharacterized membrane protein YqhA
MFRRALVSTRYMILLAVFGALVAVVLLLVYASIVEIQTIVASFGSVHSGAKGLKDLVLGLIEVIDVFLLATGFYLIAMGLYELFIDEQLDLPGGLVIHDFDDLKGNLISIVVVVLGVTFLKQIVKWEGNADLLEFGVATGLVIAALTYFISVKSKKSKPKIEDIKE